MQDEEGNRDHEETAYGAWGWIGGLLLGAFLIWIMFALATGFA